MSDRNVPEHHQAPQLSIGDLAFDTRTRALGVVMDTGADGGDGRYALRPPRGGIEWYASHDDVRPATVADQLRPALTEVNARSRGDVTW
ncbi:hypothetical protein AB0D49_12120 [Streptomyces sp. NPDC048290]|uniref:hypothetical protein n=1 Tax=Streptomyces sp. NPDC048290 TaxID=3155811 RepID=UPI0034439E9F